LQVTVLGSGTVDPRPERASTGFALEMSGGPPILLDLGAGTLRSALLAGVAMARVETILLTHHHPDHTSDLVPFLFARKYAPEAWQESPPLTIYGPHGTADFLERIFTAWPSIKPDQSKLNVVEIGPKGEPSLLPGDIRLEAFEAVHGDMTALSFRLHCQGKIVAFSGDTALCPGLTEAAREADLFFCECSCFPRGVEPLYCRKVHLSWEDVAEVCEIARPRQLVLTHLYELVLQRQPNPLQSLSQRLPIPVQLAEDRAVYTV
jgi:ribonuclease BN (tRNA processing enzyme)